MALNIGQLSRGCWWWAGVGIDLGFGLWIGGSLVLQYIF
jgi:hypothetical protein